MSENRIEMAFADRQVGKVRLLPYFTSGFPDNTVVAGIILAADRLGCPVIEIGVPFSDSIADGPVIQESFHYALERGHKVQHAFELAAQVRASVNCGLLAMISFSLVERMGLSVFAREASLAGFDGLVLPDVPIEESDDVTGTLESVGLAHVGLVAPTTSPSRRRAIVERSRGFVYQIAATGTTGERDDLPAGLTEDVASLRGLTSLPICVGFGISTPQQVRQVCAAADGAIVGSVMIRRLAEALRQGEDGKGIIQAALDLLRGLGGDSTPNPA